MIIPEELDEFVTQLGDELAQGSITIEQFIQKIHDYVNREERSGQLPRSD